MLKIDIRRARREVGMLERGGRVLASPTVPLDLTYPYANPNKQATARRAQDEGVLWPSGGRGFVSTAVSYGPESSTAYLRIARSHHMLLSKTTSLTSHPRASSMKSKSDMLRHR
eukprot:1707443-Pyramimonas_sp.AAC.1